MFIASIKKNYGAKIQYSYIFAPYFFAACMNCLFRCMGRGYTFSASTSAQPLSQRARVSGGHTCFRSIFRILRW